MSQNPPEFTFERSAAWKGISPAKVLGSAVRARASGTLKIRIAKIVRQFVFHEGSVLLSTSNAKSELPGAFLQREGRFTPEQFNRYMEEISKTKESLWALAVRQAPLTPAEAVPLKAKYICEIAGTVFSAPAGDMEFQPGTAGFESAGPVHGVRFLIDAFSKTPPPLLEGLCPDLTSKNRIAVDVLAEKAWGALPLSPEERGLLTVVRTNSQVQDVYSSCFLGEARITRLLTAFWLAGLVELVPADVAELKAHEAALSAAELKERKDLLSLQARLGETPYYDWLLLSPRAGAEEIKRAGAERIERLASPQMERLFLPRERSLLLQLTDKTREAFAVLQNPAQRREYDAFVASGKRGSFLSESKVGREQELLQAGDQFLKQGKTEDALKLWESGISELPAAPSLLAAFARAALKAGKAHDIDTRNKVTSALRQGLQADPRNAVLYEVLGEWMEALDQPGRATEAFQWAVSFAPHSNPAQEGLRRLDPKNAPLLALLALAKTYERLTYYDLLGVRPKAALKEIQGAYRECTRRFHPDRFFKSEDPNARKMANEIYKRMVKAYTTLKDPSTRQEYDARLRKGEQAQEAPEADPAMQEPPIPPKTQKGKKFFEQALLALRQGNVEHAKLNLKLGLQVEPDATAIRQKLEELGS